MFSCNFQVIVTSFHTSIVSRYYLCLYGHIIHELGATDQRQCLAPARQAMPLSCVRSALQAGANLVVSNTVMNRISP